MSSRCVDLTMGMNQEAALPILETDKENTDKEQERGRGKAIENVTPGKTVDHI